MRTGWKLFIGLAAVAGIALLVHTFGRPRPKPPEADTQPVAVEPAAPATEVTNPPSFFTRHSAKAASQEGAGGEQSGSPAASTEVITNWEDRIDQILTADGDTSLKAKQMLEMFPHLPEAGQVEVSKHLSNLVPNDDYAPLARILADPQVPAEALDTLMADVLNRPNSLKLPALLEVVRTPGHPKSTNAKEVLGFLLEADYGDDWDKWQEKVGAWLKENPD